MSITTYLFVFLEGFLAFISPCILPMLPIYIVYLAGGNPENDDRRQLIVNTIGFIIGFTIIFVLYGATATSLGSLLGTHKSLLRQISGILMILMGLNFAGILNIPFINIEKRLHANVSNLKFLPSVVFGLAYATGWSACVGTFLGSALLLAANKATVVQGMFMLFIFSMGLAVPFMISTLIIDKLKSTFQFIKRHYRVMNILSGILLILAGLAMLFDVIGYWTRLFRY